MSFQRCIELQVRHLTAFIPFLILISEFFALKTVKHFLQKSFLFSLSFMLFAIAVFSIFLISCDVFFEGFEKNASISSKDSFLLFLAIKKSEKSCIKMYQNV